MMKNLLIAAAVVFTTAASAQVGGRIVKAGETPVKFVQLSNSESALPSTCYSLSTITGTGLSIGTAASDTSFPGCSPNAGYVLGSNCYGDLEKANSFAAPLYSTVSSPSVSQVLAYFFKNGTRGTGGSSTTVVSCRLYAGTIGSGPTGNALATATAAMPAILASQVGTTSLLAYTFNFMNTPTVPTTGFFVSISTPTTAGDTVVVFSDPASNANYTWEKIAPAPGTWSAMNVSWGGSYKGNMAVFPTVCGNTVSTNVSANTGISNHVQIMPNPSNGQFNAYVNLNSQENISITVTNVIGQIVYDSKHEGVLRSRISIDLSNESNGIYFVTVSNGADKMVQRVVISK